MSISIKLKARASLKGVGLVLRQPRYIGLAVILGVVLMGVMLWLFNLNLLGYIFFASGLGWLQKIQFVLDGYKSLFTNFDSPSASTMVVLVVLMSINFSLLAYVLRRKGSDRAKHGGKSGLALVAATLGSGCAVCGTGILGSVLAATGAAGTASLVRSVGIGANLIGIILVVYSIYGLGQQAAAAFAKQAFEASAD